MGPGLGSPRRAPSARGLIARLWGRAGLQVRFVVAVSAALLVILTAQNIVNLSSELADREARVAARGTAIVQAAAAASGRAMESEDREAFRSLVAKVGEAVDLIELAVVDGGGRIVAHSDPARVGQTLTRSSFGAVGPPHVELDLRALFGGFTEHAVSASILRGTRELGFVGMRFRTREITQHVRATLLSSMGMGALWLALGALAATLLVRRITRPLVELTRVAAAVSAGRLDEAIVPATRGRDEVATLQGAFRQLVEALRAERGRTAQLMDELKGANEGLRERVDAVTADLRATGAYLESVIRCMDEGVITCDRAGRIVRVNQGAARHLEGLGAPEPGAHISTALPDAEPLAAAVVRAVERGEAQDLTLERRAEEQGAMRSLALRVNPLAGADGSAMGAVVTLVDETDKRRVEAQLRRHDRLISLGTLAAGLAHELGNCMHAINGYSGLLLRSIDEDDPRRADVTTIHQENGRAVELLDRFLEFARPSEVHHRPEPIDALVREALDISGLRLRRLHVTVWDELGAEGLLVRCDPRLLSQVLVNLLLNAVDAMEGLPDPVLTVGSALVEGGRVQVWVRDTGHGIEATQLDRIWDPFYTTKAETGTGLGLSIAHQIVDRHGGTVTVESTPGSGACFRIELPLDGRPGGDA